MKNINKLCRFQILLFWLVTLFPTVCLSQTVSIEGIVQDSDKVALIGASIVEKGTTNGTITDVNGHFSLKVPSNATLLVSFIGYLEKEIQLNGKKQFTITLQEDNTVLNEVVVIGYGSMARKEVCCIPCIQ